jgi:hypothetical protein
LVVAFSSPPLWIAFSGPMCRMLREALGCICPKPRLPRLFPKPTNEECPWFPLKFNADPVGFKEANFGPTWLWLRTDWFYLMKNRALCRFLPFVDVKVKVASVNPKWKMQKYRKSANTSNLGAIKMLSDLKVQ